MPPDPQEEKRRLTRQWLDKARDDLLAAERAAADPPLMDIVLFHCQQAAEKALKAYLTWRDQPFRKVHDLEELVRQCVALEAAFDGLEQAGKVLSAYAVEPRYPHDDEPTLADVRQARSLAERVLTFVAQRLPP